MRTDETLQGSPPPPMSREFASLRAPSSSSFHGPAPSKIHAREIRARRAQRHEALRLASPHEAGGSLGAKLQVPRAFRSIGWGILSSRRASSRARTSSACSHSGSCSGSFLFRVSRYRTSWPRRRSSGMKSAESSRRSHVSMVRRSTAQRGHDCQMGRHRSVRPHDGSLHPRPASRSTSRADRITSSAACVPLDKPSRARRLSPYECGRASRRCASRLFFA
jgi:hypothetical protein